MYILPYVQIIFVFQQFYQNITFLLDRCLMLTKSTLMRILSHFSSQLKFILHNEPMTFSDWLPLRPLRIMYQHFYQVDRCRVVMNSKLRKRKLRLLSFLSIQSKYRISSSCFQFNYLTLSEGEPAKNEVWQFW